MNQHFLVLFPPMNEPNGHSPSNGPSIGGRGQTDAERNGSGHASVPIDWEHLARSTAHPLRISILEILGMERGRILSPSELSQELQIPLSNTNYHVTELAKAKLIVLARQRQVRGATEHFYRLPGAAGTASKASEKRTTGLEPATSSLGSLRSTN
jgi:DNA-binding transcriptional ArsR family regulator